MGDQMTDTLMAERADRLARIRRLSGFMKWFLTVVMGLVVIIGLFLVVTLCLPADLLFTADEMIDIADVERRMGDIPLGQRIAIAGLTGLAFFLIAGACWHIRLVFKRFQHIEFFDPRTLSSVVSFGRWLIIFAIVDLISDPVGSALLTLDLPEGQRSIDVTLDGGELFFLILGSLMLVFGWILREAALIAEENKQFI
ncbi:DUF2975 domain-containing protein [Roseibium hamelinense]|nr:DUF2975 domain-containing protein [Roseibium hamelinense]MTI42065.1 DUF2975 domain-containing protein [Roseibium hamelinense]